MNAEQPMDDLTLPPLTHVGWEVDGVEPVYAYTADQMREYAKQAVEAEREACAALLESNGAACGEESLTRLVLETNAAAIRAR